MPTLKELRAEFVRLGEGGGIFREVPTIAEAQGVMFLCPLCFKANGGARGTHRVVCWSRSRGVPDDVQPGPGRWTLDGSCIDDLTLNGDPPGNARSVQLIGGCAWHGHVNSGSAE